MTRIHMGASRRLPPRITMLSTPKYKWKEERKRVLKLSVKKLRSIEDPEAFLSRSVLINNTLKRLQTEVREEKAKKSEAIEMHSTTSLSSNEGCPVSSSNTALATYSPSPYSFYSIERAYREEIEHTSSDNNNGSVDTLETSAFTDVNHRLNHEQIDEEEEDSTMFEADDEAEDSEDGSDASSGSDSSSSDEDEIDECENSTNTLSDNNDNTDNNVVTKDNGGDSKKLSLEEELLSDVPPPSLPPPPQIMLPEVEDSKGLAVKTRSPSQEAVMKNSECCDNVGSEDDLYSEAVRTECWTKPISNAPRTTLSSTSSAVNTWPNLEWPTYVPSTASNGSTSDRASSPTASFSPNISVPMCSSHKENLFQVHHPSTQIAEKCYSCGQSSLFQSELQSVVFNSLITSLET